MGKLYENTCQFIIALNHRKNNIRGMFTVQQLATYVYCIATYEVCLLRNNLQGMFIV